MQDKKLFPMIGLLKVEELDEFIASRGWNCSHCNNNDYIVEEYAETGLCSVSSVPYVAYEVNMRHFVQTGNGFPAYTVLCSNCFSVSKYHAVLVMSKLKEI